MSNRSKAILLIAIVAFLAAAVFAYIYWPHSSFPNENSTVSASLPSIPTPPGWYSWGTNHYLDYETSTVPNSETFGDQPINNSGNNTTTLIVANTENLYGRTNMEWITNVLYPEISQLNSPTSSELWSVINGKLVLEAITQTPAGGYDLNYSVFDDGAVYSFSLNPWHSENLFTGQDAQTLRGMVQKFTADLPS